MNSESDSKDLPEGTVTFLFTDIEGSTDLLKRLGDSYTELLDVQRRIVRECCERWDGQEVDTQGDSFFISFPRATQAISAAAEIQRAVHEHEWPEAAEVRLRMGLHTGEPSMWEEGYVGMDVHRAARIAHIGHGGQVLLSETTTPLMRDELPEGVTLLDLGSHVLKDISQPEQIHQLLVAGLTSNFPPLTSLESRPNNLPVQSTPFVGRVDELEALDALIGDSNNRLISILGAGGMGKTRLAITAAEQQLNTLISSNGDEEPRFTDGVFFVGLAPLETPDAIIPTIGKATGFQFYEGADFKKQILDYLRRKRMLLLMDNFEHLKEGGNLLTDIIQAAPDLKILVTSREKLNLGSEVPYVLRGMRFPGGDDTFFAGEPLSAIELFLQRTQQIHPDFVPDEEELNSIGRICRLVEGMPLGVELAAAWMELLSPGEIASEIQRSLDFLEAEKLDAPERHRSIRAVFDYTWNMLSESEREILKSISVFRGGFTPEAAREVAEASNKQLLGLVNKSLLQRSSVDRLAIHELLRQYAAEALKKNQAEEDDVRDLHCAYYADFLHEREAAIDGGDISQALEDIDNIRTAWHWAVRQEKIPEIRKQLYSLSNLNDFQGWYTEGEAAFKWASTTLHQRKPAGKRGIVYGSLLTHLGFFSYRCGKEKEGIELVRKSQEILRRLKAKPELAYANSMFGFLCTSENYSEARRQLLESIEYYKGKDISWEMTYLINTMGNIEFFEKNFLESEVYYLEGLKLGTALNNQRSIAWATAGLGGTAIEQGHYQIGKEYIVQAYEIFHAIGYKNIAGVMLNNLGNVLLLLGEIEEAKKRYLQALAINEKIGRQIGEGASIQGLGDVAFAKGDYEQAKVHYCRSLEIFKNLEDLTDTGYLLGELGKVSAALGQDQDAQSNFREAMEVGLNAQNVPLCLAILERLTVLLGTKGEVESAVEVASLAANHPLSHAYTRENAKKTLVELKSLMALDDFIAAEERGRRLDPLHETNELLIKFEEHMEGMNS